MSTEVIEGTAVEIIPPERAIIPAQPGQALVAADDDKGQDRMLVAATRIATALTRMVEAQNLYTTIRGKKYPHVEAWMTIGRMDNVVAREAERPIKNDDGSWEAYVELVRLSDGMVIGRASAMAGGKGDGDWTGRPDHVKRSMAVTRATSRAFRQQYSWVMTLAGYQPTPADEMPDDHGQTHGSRVDEGQIGTASLGRIAPVDGQLRQTPQGYSVGFVIGEGRGKVQAVATGPQAEAFATILPSILGKRVQAYGPVSSESMTVRGNKVPFLRVALTRLVTPDESIDFTAPLSVAPEPSGEPVEAESLEMFSDEEQARIDAALASVVS